MMGRSALRLDNPPAIYDSVFSVGAVDQGGNMAPFSSRGPVTIDGSNRIKPDISAPGVDVVSSLPERNLWRRIRYVHGWSAPGGRGGIDVVCKFAIDR